MAYGLSALSDRGRIRTFDRLLRRQMLYPAELRHQTKGSPYPKKGAYSTVLLLNLTIN